MIAKRAAAWSFLLLAVAVGTGSVVESSGPAAVAWAVTNPPGAGKAFEGPYKASSGGTVKVTNDQVGGGPVCVVVHEPCCGVLVSQTMVANATTGCIPVGAGDTITILDQAKDGLDAGGDITVP